MGSLQDGIYGWSWRWPRGAFCTTLVLEEVLANGYARVIVSVGTSAAWDEPLPWFLRATGGVVDGELRV
jgi:hypothetical protein